MTVITEYFTKAELALAAYAKLTPGISGKDYTDALEDSSIGMSAIQAQNFASNWRVIAQYDGKVEETYIDEFGQEHVIFNPTGVSATVFENVDDGKCHLAIRGTNDPNDIVTDFIDILVLGTPERQAQYTALKKQVGKWLSNGTLTPGFAVCGHSLGGFLAGALLVDYPVEIDHAYLYNSPGIGGLSAGLRLLAGMETEPTLDLTKVSNLIAEAGLSLAAGLGLDWSAPISIVIEDQFPNLTANHSIEYLTDVLAIYDLFAKTDQTVSVETVSSILRAASNKNPDTLESAMSTLGAIYGKSYSATATDRNTLFTNLYDLQEAAANNPGTVVSLSGQNRDQIINLAKTDIAYRYALRELIPFTITGNDSLYAPHNINGALDLYDPATEQGEVSELYLEDRTAMLTWKMQFDSGGQDADDLLPGDKSYSHEWDTWGLIDDWKYTDVGRNLTLNIDGVGGDIHNVIFGSESGDTITGDTSADHLYGRGGDDTIDGQAGNDYIEGNSGRDILYGNVGNDILEGGADDDILFGDADDDLMIGGEGIDIYYVEGHDTIRDTGNNLIVYDGQLLAGAFIREEGTSTYRFLGNNNITLTFNSPGHLVLNGTNSVTFANQTSAADFANGDFCITLFDSVSADRVLTGTDGDDNSEVMSMYVEDHWEGHYVFSGSVSGDLTDDYFLPSHAEFNLTGDTPPNLSIDGGAGNDLLYGGGRVTIWPVLPAMTDLHCPAC